MSQNAHIFTPKDDSLQSRVESIKNVLKAYRNVELSLKLAKDKNDDTLGSIDEIKQAHSITQNSLNIAIKSLSTSELEQAKKQGLISSEEIKEMSIQKHKSEMSDFRENKRSNNKDGASFKL